jgi:hypothetical protein
MQGRYLCHEDNRLLTDYDTVYLHLEGPIRRPERAE